MRAVTSQVRLGEAGGVPEGSRSVAVGTVATVWEGEVAGMRLALESVAVSLLLVLLDSQIAIASVRNSAA